MEVLKYAHSYSIQSNNDIKWRRQEGYKTYYSDQLCGEVTEENIVYYHTDMWKNGDDTSKAEYKEKVDYFITNYSAFPIGEYGLGTPSYAPALSEVDYDMNPIEWTHQRLGGWNDNYDY